MFWCRTKEELYPFIKKQYFFNSFDTAIKKLGKDYKQE